MRLKILLALLFASAVALAVDLSVPVQTPNYQNYNQTYRAVGDGSNASTEDSVTPNLFSYVQAVGSDVVKATPGYLDNITLNALCGGSYIIADANAGAVSYATVISTISHAGTSPLNVPYHLRFATGLTITIFASTCPVTVSYR